MKIVKANKILKISKCSSSVIGTLKLAMERAKTNRWTKVVTIGYTKDGIIQPNASMMKSTDNIALLEITKQRWINEDYTV